MSSSRGCPLQLLNKDDNVEVDDIDAYLHFEDEDHDLSTIIIYLEDGAGRPSHRETEPNLMHSKSK